MNDESILLAAIRNHEKNVSMASDLRYSLKDLFLRKSREKLINAIIDWARDKKDE